MFGRSFCVTVSKYATVLVKLIGAKSIVSCCAGANNRPIKSVFCAICESTNFETWTGTFGWGCCKPQKTSKWLHFLPLRLMIVLYLLCTVSLLWHWPPALMTALTDITFCEQMGPPFFSHLDPLTLDQGHLVTFICNAWLHTINVFSYETWLV